MCVHLNVYMCQGRVRSTHPQAYMDTTALSFRKDLDFWKEEVLADIPDALVHTHNSDSGYCPDRWAKAISLQTNYHL